ncbi:pyridoxamine 5'-phosphate oxidase family protein, partial [Nocardia sp. NPDC004654]|uniref:pyridoxamine 5'-phosphate oxidase family protein n=1 Tax=Nocardia sp. NPDC004654 TaxID=3154776 RepID=UPI0033BEF133
MPCSHDRLLSVVLSIVRAVRTSRESRMCRVCPAVRRPHLDDRTRLVRRGLRNPWSSRPATFGPDEKRGRADDMEHRTHSRTDRAARGTLRTDRHGEISRTAYTPDPSPRHRTRHATVSGSPTVDRTDHNLIELTREEALTLLAQAPFGRVVYTHDALPAIRPVNHLLDNNLLIVR